MNALAQAAADAALEILNGKSDSGLPREADLDQDPAIKPLVDQVLEHEQAAEKRQADWLAKHK